MLLEKQRDYITPSHSRDLFFVIPKPPTAAEAFLLEITMPRDIIYILKPMKDAPELVYSLRSVERNFPHRLVWFIGSCPKGLKPDRFIPHDQAGQDKWSRIRSSMLKIITEPELSDEFFLFNDDFFVMKPVKRFAYNYADLTLTDRMTELRGTMNLPLNAYGRTLYKAREELKGLGCGEVNFEVHLPMLFEKEKVPSIRKCSSPQMRSIYGNINGIKYRQKTDVKVYDLTTVPTDADYLSTNDETFLKGAVGEYIRETFPDASRFET